MDEKTQHLPEAYPNDPNDFASSDMIHSDLLATQELVYNPCRFEYTHPLPEVQNADYGAYIFNMNTLSIRFRVAKTTPTKIGQFVTLWERIGEGPIQPYDVSEPVDFYVISTRKGSNFGQFIIPKAVLCDRDIISNQGKGGKRAIRVYPPWDNPTSRQAQKTQLWQLNYFLKIPSGISVNIEQAQTLYGL